MPMVWKRRVRSVVSLCWASLRMLPLRAGSLASFALALWSIYEVSDYLGCGSYGSRVVPEVECTS